MLYTCIFRGSPQALDNVLRALLVLALMSGQIIVTLMGDCPTSIPSLSVLYCKFRCPTVFDASKHSRCVPCSALNYPSACNYFVLGICPFSSTMKLLPFVIVGFSILTICHPNFCRSNVSGFCQNRIFVIGIVRLHRCCSHFGSDVLSQSVVTPWQSLIWLGHRILDPSYGSMYYVELQLKQWQLPS